MVCELLFIEYFKQFFTSIKSVSVNIKSLIEVFIKLHSFYVSDFIFIEHIAITFWYRKLNNSLKHVMIHFFAIVII